MSAVEFLCPICKEPVKITEIQSSHFLWECKHWHLKEVDNRFCWYLKADNNLEPVLKEPSPESSREAKLRAVVEMVATPDRGDGEYNRYREICAERARMVLLELDCERYDENRELLQDELKRRNKGNF